MKFLGITLVLSLAAACTGNINGNGEGNGDPSVKDPDPSNPSHPNDPGTKPPGDMTGMLPPDKTPPDTVVGKCTVATLAKPRVWRLTHAQLKNTLKDTLGYTPPSIASFPAEA